MPAPLLDTQDRAEADWWALALAHYRTLDDFQASWVAVGATPNLARYNPLPPRPTLPPPPPPAVDQQPIRRKPVPRPPIRRKPVPTTFVQRVPQPVPPAVIRRKPVGGRPLIRRKPVPPQHLQLPYVLPPLTLDGPALDGPW